jgi:hypothetical protein
MSSARKLQPPPDPNRQPQPEIYRHAAELLHHALPPPPNDTPEARALRDSTALAQVVGLEPGNALEVTHAVHCILAVAHADDCLRQADQHAADPKLARQLHNQSASMQRSARADYALLRKIQTVRRKRDADPVARERHARDEQYLLGLWTEAMERATAKAAPPPAAPEPARPDPSRAFGRPIDLRLWDACPQAGPPIRIAQTLH